MLQHLLSDISMDTRHYQLVVGLRSVSSPRVVDSFDSNSSQVLDPAVVTAS
jgi:hypothetical protein